MLSLIRKLFATKPQAARKSAVRPLALENLGERIMPAALLYDAGNLTLTARPGEAANVQVGTFKTDGETYVFVNDFVENRTNVFHVADIKQITFIGGELNDKFQNDTNISATFYGSFGNDVLIGGSANEKFFCGLGDDKVTAKGGDDYIIGEEGNDTLDGGDGKDYLSGGFGDDVLIGGAGQNIINGGPGSDTLYDPGLDDILRGGVEHILTASSPV